MFILERCVIRLDTWKEVPAIDLVGDEMVLFCKAVDDINMQSTFQGIPESWPWPIGSLHICSLSKAGGHLMQWLVKMFFGMPASYIPEPGLSSGSAPNPSFLLICMFLPFPPSSTFPWEVSHHPTYPAIFYLDIIPALTFSYYPDVVFWFQMCPRQARWPILFL